jgi:hypothetical protein
MDNFAVEICYDLPRFAASFNLQMQPTDLAQLGIVQRMNRPKAKLTDNALMEVFLPFDEGRRGARPNVS